MKRGNSARQTLVIQRLIRNHQVVSPSSLPLYAYMYSVGTVTSCHFRLVIYVYLDRPGNIMEEA